MGWTRDYWAIVNRQWSKVVHDEAEGSESGLNFDWKSTPRGGN